MGMDYMQVEEGEIYSVKLNNKAMTFWDRCCDCGLVHRMKVRADHPCELRIQTWRDNRRTGAIRRKKK